MTNLNKVILMGNIVRDLDEHSYGFAANGVARANLSIAVNRSRKQGEEWVDDTSFFDITVWGKTAENLKQYFVKGQKIAVEGYLKQERWEKDGQKHSKISIVAEHVELCGTKGNSNNAGNQQQNFNNNQNNFNQNNNQNFNNSGYNENYAGDYGDPDDIPF